MMAFQRLREKPLLDRCPSNLAFDRALVNGAYVFSNPGGQFTKSLMFKHLTYCRFKSALLQSGTNLQRFNRVSAKLKEIGAYTQLIHIKKLLPNFSHHRFNLISRTDIISCISVFFRFWQGFLIELSINSHRDAVNLYHTGRQHKVRQGVF
ncbi:Uncharacterised protein [Streptococcus pneumoniae]|nr:Uncharacterised protein [Streptococcus pneumoniae]